jgi:hypothetical protein
MGSLAINSQRSKFLSPEYSQDADIQAIRFEANPAMKSILAGSTTKGIYVWLVCK